MITALLPPAVEGSDAPDPEEDAVPPAAEPALGVVGFAAWVGFGGWVRGAVGGGGVGRGLGFGDGSGVGGGVGDGVGVGVEAGVAEGRAAATAAADAACVGFRLCSTADAIPATKGGMQKASARPITIFLRVLILGPAGRRGGIGDLYGGMLMVPPGAPGAERDPAWQR